MIVLRNYAFPQKKKYKTSEPTNTMKRSIHLFHFKRAQCILINHVTKEPWPLWFLPTYQKFKTGAILTYNLLNKQGEYTMWSGICTVKAAGELCRDRNCHCKVGSGFGIDHPDPKSL